MPKNIFALDYKKFAVLKTEICSKFGRNISAHCDVLDLCVTLNNDYKLKISSQTLKRIFGLINDSTTPSVYSLNILCRFIGYPDWKSFQENNPSLKNIGLVKKSGSSLRDFYTYDIYEFWNNFYYSCRQRAFEIYEEPETVEKEQLLVSLGNLPAAHNSYFELFPNLDHLNKRSYKQGLKSYLSTKKTEEATFFVNSLLYLGAYLSDNEIESKIYSTNLKRSFDINNVFALPRIRKSLCLLMEAHRLGKNISDLCQSIVDECLELNKEIPSIPNVATTAILHLLLCGLPRLAFRIYQNVTLYPQNSTEYPSHNLFLHSVRTLEALVLGSNGYMDQSKTLFVTIDTDKYELYFSKVYKSLYCILSIMHGDNKALDELILLTNETGYKRILRLAQEYSKVI